MTPLPKGTLKKMIKNASGKREAKRVTSINLTETQYKFLQRRDISISKLAREIIDQMIEAERDEK